MNFIKKLERLTGELSRRSQDETGSALVEFAISSIVILGTFLAVFQMSVACYHYNTVAEITRETARWAAVRGSTCSVNTPGLDNCNASATTIRDQAKKYGAINWSQCTTSNPCVTVSYKTATTTLVNSKTATTWSDCSSGTCNLPGNMIVVSMTYPYSLNLPFVNKFSINLGSTSEMIVAQ